MNKVVISNKDRKTEITINGMTMKGVKDFNIGYDTCISMPVVRIEFYAADTQFEVGNTNETQQD